MSEAKPTPGPWWIAGEKAGECSLITPTVRGYMDGTRRVTICRTGNGDHRDYELANARLIAAAPELLEALQDCREALRRAEAEGELKVVDAAIAKAGGAG